MMRVLFLLEFARPSRVLSMTDSADQELRGVLVCFWKLGIRYDGAVGEERFE